MAPRSASIPHHDDKGLELIEAFHLFPVGSMPCGSSSTRNRSSIPWSNTATAPRSPSLAPPTCACRSPRCWPGRSGWTRSCAARSCRHRHPYFPPPGRRPLSRYKAGAPCGGGGRGGAGGAQCRERGGSGRLPCRSDCVHPHAAHVENVLTCYAPPAPASLADVIATDAEARARARSLMEPA